MAEDTPSASSPEGAAPKKPARKSDAKKAPARKAAPASATAAPAASASDTTASAAEAPQASAPVPPAAVPVPGSEHPAPHRRSFLEGVRANRVGPVTAGLLVAIVVGLLLSVLVPGDPNLLAMVILGTLLSAAVGFTVRYLATGASLLLQAEAFLVTVIGVHLMGVTGLVSGDIPLLSELGVDGPGFNEALLASLATPPVSTGGLLAGVVAAIIVGWGERTGHARSE
jgi:hypothetical protein